MNRTLFTRRLWNFPAPGVPENEMEFCGEPTSDGDTVAEYVRTWYERNREGWYDRLIRRSDTADEFILWLISEVARVNDVRERQTKGVKS